MRRGISLAGAIAAAGTAAGCAAILTGLAGLGDAGALKVAGLGAIALTLFATRAIPEIVTALIVFLLALAIGTAPAEVIFSGFGTGGFWLMFSGIVLGAAIVSTGLARAVSNRLFAMTGSSWTRALYVTAVAGLVLGLLIPSTVPRVIVLLPITISLGERLGYAPTSRGGIGLAAMAATSTLLPTYMILTANLPTIVQAGAMEQLYGQVSTWSGYIAAQAPVNVLRFVMLVTLLLKFSEPPADGQGDPADETPASPAASRLLVVLCIAILLWATDFAHGIAPAWIAMAAAAVALLPAAGISQPGAMKSQIDLSPTFFIAAIFAVAALAHAEGLDRRLADAMIAAFGIGTHGPLATIYAMFLVSVVVSHLTTAPAAPLVLAPFAGPLAEATGLSLEAIFMIQIIGIATPILPYQAPPLVVAMSLSSIPNAVLFRLCIVLAVVVTVLGIPLTFLWWKLIGLV